MSGPRILLAPSILAADFARLGEEVAAVSELADRVHVDVMDGRFVPNLSMGPMVVAALARVTRCPLEVHLMVVQPERFLEAFAEAGAASIQVQVESTPALYRAVTEITRRGLKAGGAINPATSLETLREILPLVDMVNVMTVEPGFGGQRFIPHSADKIARLRAMAPDLEIEVDGGIDSVSAPVAVRAGATVLVAGTSVFNHPEGPAAGARALLEAAR